MKTLKESLLADIEASKKFLNDLEKNGTYIQ